MKTIWTAKITCGNRIAIGKDVMDRLNVNQGDYVQVYEEGDRLMMGRVDPPREE